MVQRRFLFAGLVAGLSLLKAQTPTAPIISARGVTNFFTQEPAPGVVGLGSLVQIVGLNLGPPDGLMAAEIPWPTQLGNVQVIVGGKAAPIYSISPGTIIAQVPVDANVGLVDVTVRRGGVSSTPAKVTVAAMAPAVRTADDSGAGVPWGKITAQAIATTATGLGPTDPKIASGDVGPSDKPAVPTNEISAYVGGLRAKVTATASTKRPGEFDINVAVPTGAGPGDLVTLFAGRQAANVTVFQPASAPQVIFLPMPDKPPTITALSDTGVNGSYLIATGARDSDGCYPALGVNLRARTIAAIPDCLTSVNANVQPLAVPANGDTVAALIGPPAGDATTGISSTVKIFSAAADPVKVTLPAAAATLTATPNSFTATLPGKPAQIATIDPETGDFQTATPAAVGGAAGGAGAGPVVVPAVDINGLKHVYASANLGNNRLAVIAGDDPLKPTKAAYAIVNNTGAITFSMEFPAGWLPLLTAVAPLRANQTAAVPLPTEPAVFDAASRTFFAIARSADASKDAFLAFPITNTDPKVVDFPDGWFAASCTADIRLLTLNLVGQVALVGSKVAETEFKTACAGTAFLMLDFSDAKIQARMQAIPLGDNGQIRVPAARTDASVALMNDYVYAVKLDSTRATTSDALYVLDGVNASVVTMPLPNAVTAFTVGTLQQVPESNSLLVQTIDKLAGDQGFVLFNLDAQTAANLPLPDGFATVASLADGTAVCCFATHKLIARAVKQGGSAAAIYDLVTGDVNVVTNPENVTSIGPAAGQSRV
ncbi:MAG: hypothetical protein JWP63_2284, partial [Candidatus Solibacter sp.]|nr:hypothetical protein [Candidatus Solibacter sp.]